jgi:dolichyl-phosphate-mannose-protein mannosyltransferase
MRFRARRPVLFWISLMTAVGLAVYVPLCLTWGYRGDIEIYMAWTYQITHFGIQSAYSPAAASPPNTTPGLLYFFWVAGEAFRHFFSPNFPPTWQDRTNQAYLRFFLRIPALLCNVGIAFIVYRLMRRRYGQTVALWAVAAYIFNPAVIFESAYYGQTGAVHSLFMLIGVVGLAEGRPAWGWAGLTAGMLTKPQADLFFPLFVFVTAQRYGRRGLVRSLLAAGGTALLMLAPFLLGGTIGEMWARVSRVTDYHPMLSATAHNFWWFASLGDGKASDLLMPPLLDRLGWPIFTYRWIGLGMVGLAYLLVLARLWWDRSSRGLYLSTAYLFLAFFMLATQIHENHLIPMFSLLLLALPGDRRMQRVYAAFAVTATLNMALHYPEILRVLVPQNPDVWGGPELALPRWLDSAAQMAVFVYWTVIFVRETASGWPAFGRRAPGANSHQAQASSTPTLTTDPATRSGNTAEANPGHAASRGFINV